MQPFETIEVDEPVVACNGGGGALGHPRVECPYCSRLFVLRGKGAAGEAGDLPKTPGAPPVAAP